MSISSLIRHSARVVRVALLGAGWACVACAASPLRWYSGALDREVSVELLEPAPIAAAADASAGPKGSPLVIYLKNLAAPRAGTESDESIVADFRRDGFLVAVLDYAHAPRARWPHLNRDLAALRTQLLHGTWLGERALDQAHIYFVPAGHRLKRNVMFAHDGTRTVALDVLYPSRPARPVGALLEFSCDNAERMGNNSLQFCTDTLLEGAASEGYAVAMADHPVRAPYRGFDAMPLSAQLVKAAVRTLRAEGAALGLDGRIVPVGFSRGSGMALMLVTTRDHPEFDTLGEHRDVSSEVQGAVVLSGRFTYLDLRPEDPMIPKYVKTWGERATHRDAWRAQGALDYLGAPTVPLFLSINATESPDALHQMAVLRRRLDALQSPYVYFPEDEPRGHRVPLAPAVLDPLLSYLRARLGAAATGPAPSPEKSPAPPQ
ncbi:MAG: hypothetical protein HYV96_00155 [Opitutae bacterium]|nr:hypothetical protein [Opitutae bacterium]